MPGNRRPPPHVDRHMTTRLALGTRIALVLAVLSFAAAIGAAVHVRLVEPTGAQSPGDATRQAHLVAGWNLVAWTGPDTPITDAIAPIRTQIEAAFVWDTGAERFRAHRPGAPAGNDLDTIHSSEGLWLLLRSDADWDQLDSVAERDVPLVAGWQIVAWTGPDATPADHALRRVDGIDAAWVWDAAEQRFVAAVATAGATPPLLDHGDAVWLRLSAPAAWPQLAHAGTLGGIVTAGPQCPVQREDEPCPDLPIEASLVIQTETEDFARVNSGPDGRYSIQLPPGDYTVRPLPPGETTFPYAAPVDVTIEAGRWTTQDISYDTGIR